MLSAIILNSRADEVNRFLTAVKVGLRQNVDGNEDCCLPSPVHYSLLLKEGQSLRVPGKKEDSLLSVSFPHRKR